MTDCLIVDILGSPRTTVAFRAVLVLIILAQAAPWHWFSGRRSRQNMFFSVRVQPGFVDSNAGRTILRNFRLRVWLWAVVVSMVFVIASGSSLPDLATSYLLLGAVVTVMLGCQFAFSMACRKTRMEATPLSEPSIRTASLSVDEEQTSAWLTLLDWMGILLPVGLPIATAILLGLHWNQFAANDDPKVHLVSVLFAGFIGIYPAATQFALRFHARSSDWAADAKASRKYRTCLGITQASLFTFIILQMCIQSVIRNVPLFPDMKVYFRFSDFADFIVFALILAMLLWLKRNFAGGSGDPMPDHCWKWGLFYYNPSDSALVVPMRTGLGYSFNYAQMSVRLIGATVFVAVILGLAHFAHIIW